MTISRFLFDMFAQLDAMGLFVCSGEPVSVRKTWAKRSKRLQSDPQKRQVEIDQIDL